MRGLVLVALQTVDSKCAARAKRILVLMLMLEFLTKLQNVEITPATLLKSDSTIDALSTILKIFEHS